MTRGYAFIVGLLVVFLAGCQAAPNPCPSERSHANY